MIISLTREYASHYNGRGYCFDPWTFVPETFDLSKENECLEIIGKLKQHLGDNRVRWIKKKARGAHSAKGVYVVTNEEAINTVNEYNNGAFCGLIPEKIII